LVNDNQSDLIHLQQLLIDLGYVSISLVPSEQEAIQALAEENYSLIITNLVLKEKVCLELLKKAVDLRVSTVVITSSSGIWAHEYPPIIENEGIAYLVKPIHKMTLKSILRLLLTKSVGDKYIFITGKHNEQIKLYLNEIIFLEVERNYCTIYTSRRNYKFVIKISLIKLLEQLDSRFIRIHNSYIVNINYIKSFTSTLVRLENYSVPLSRTYKKEFSKLLSILRNQHR